MTRDEKALPGEILIRLLCAIVTLGVWLAVPLIIAYQWRKRHEILWNDMVALSVIGGILLVGWAFS